MPNIRDLVVKYLSRVTLVMVTIILVVSVLTQILDEQRQAKESSVAVFYQIEQILTENQNELIELKEEYSQTCLKNAEVIAYIIQYHPEILGDVDEFKRIAELIEVDEIHIFDKTGRIFTGTHPEYYNLTFDSGEQIGFFKPMLEDKTLKLCQEITPNTAEEKMMQYSALWSEDGEFIVQVGMEPVNVMKVTEKNELSYIFSLLRANVGVNLYAIDEETGEIMGSTVSGDVGKNLTEIGMSMDEIERRQMAFHTYVNGEYSYCVYTRIGSNLILRVVPGSVLYQNIPVSAIELAVCLGLIALILVAATTGNMNKVVINGIYEINDKLRAISEGRLDETIDVQNSLEFHELSSHINEMIKSLLASTDKISYVLNTTDLNIGVYEYNEKMKHVRFTEYVPRILALDEEEERRLTSDYRLFQEYINGLRENPVTEEDKIYHLQGDKERYIKLQQINYNNDILGVVMDVTEEIVKRRQIEAERDIDPLTGLYNRRGIESRLAALFAKPEELKYGALIMIDADGLKTINDKYGHEKGDMYLKKIAEGICSVGSKGCIAARQGGDEYVLFLYRYDSEEELLKSVESLENIQDNRMVCLDDDLSVPFRFSFGYSLIKGETDYMELLKQADERMYTSKRERKKQL